MVIWQETHLPALWSIIPSRLPVTMLHPSFKSISSDLSTGANVVGMPSAEEAAAADITSIKARAKVPIWAFLFTPRFPSASVSINGGMNQSAAPIA